MHNYVISRTQKVVSMNLWAHPCNGLSFLSLRLRQAHSLPPHTHFMIAGLRMAMAIPVLYASQKLPLAKQPVQNYFYALSLIRLFLPARR